MNRYYVEPARGKYPWKLVLRKDIVRTKDGISFTKGTTRYFYYERQAQAYAKLNNDDLAKQKLLYQPYIKQEKP